MPSISRVSGHLLAMGFVGAASMFATPVVAQDFPMSAPSSASTGAQIGTQSSDADFEAMLSGAIPVEQLLDLASRSAPGAPQAQAAPMMATGSPMVHGGQQGASIRITVDEDTLRAADGTSASESLATALADAGIGPQNYGQNQANSLYHYNDYREFPRPTF
ncbi:hypothetical protein [Pararhodobacter sp. CCB-MM2]|uniref:hypothetical protein n=1 Tax=Pararhodobacter sp. CCB-MM2 TaxID=1786003 RepID=UPI001111A089|nr:hypothetical protein [Pararhodobacter sp. CCB-MM2]